MEENQSMAKEGAKNLTPFNKLHKPLFNLNLNKLNLVKDDFSSVKNERKLTLNFPIKNTEIKP